MKIKLPFKKARELHARGCISKDANSEWNKWFSDRGIDPNTQILYRPADEYHHSANADDIPADAQWSKESVDLHTGQVLHFWQHSFTEIEIQCSHQVEVEFRLYWL